MSVKDLLMNDAEETPIPVEVPITGTIPQWLTGTYYKIGNGKFKLPSGHEINYLLDGYSFIFECVIEDNKVRFRSKYLNSNAYKEALEFGKPTYAGLSTRQHPNPNKGFLSRMISSVIPTDVSDNNCINVLQFDDEIYALADSLYMLHIDKDTLQTDAKVDLKQLGILLPSGHYFVDDMGTAYNVASALQTGMVKNKLFKISPNKSKKPGAVIDPKRDVQFLVTLPKESVTSTAHYHSFGISENYFVVIEHPLILQVMTFLTGQIQGKTILDCMTWDPEKKSKFHLIDRKTNTVIQTSYVSSAFCFMHIANAYEEDGHLIIDLIAHDGMDMMTNYLMDKLRNDELKQSGKFRRFVLPIKNIAAAKERENLVTLSSSKAGAVKVNNDLVLVSGETLFEEPLDEFVNINKKFCGRKYRYVYSVSLFYNHPIQKHLVKLDLETKEMKTWKSSNDDHFPSEPIFVPNPDGTEEDDGIIITVLIEAGKRKSVLLFLDAKSFTEVARAEFDCDAIVGNHGTFVFKKN